MKRFLLSAFITLSFFVSKAATITWIGTAGDGLWSNSLNWFPATVPGPGDDVILDNSFFVTSYAVSLPTGAVTVSVNSLTITPSAASFGITLGLPSGNTADPGFIATGPGDAVVLNDKAAFFNSSGAAPGATPVQVTGTNFFRINNGGRYIHNTERGHTTNLVERLSSVPGTENGSFEFDVPGTGNYFISASGRTYGTLRLLGTASGGVKTYSSISGTSALTVNGNLIIEAMTTYTFDILENVTVYGNLQVESGCTFNLSGTTNNNSSILNLKGNLYFSGTISETGTGVPEIQLNATCCTQVINPTGGSILNTIDFNLNNAAGASLLGNLTLPYRYTITSGSLLLSDNNFTTPVINQVSAATHSANHIITNGTGSLTIQNITTVPIDFPVGPSADSLNTVTISDGGGSNFSVRVNKDIVPTIAFPTYGIDRTWNIKASVVTTGVTVSFQYASNDANPGVSPPEAMEILQNDGAVWSIIAGNTNISTGGGDPYWIITSATPLAVNDISTPYALGKNGGWILPLDYVITCRAQKINNTAFIGWSIADADNVNTFEVQRSVNSSGFQTITTVSPVINQLQYSYSDAALEKGISLYRIKVNRRSGAIRYSNTVAIINDSKGLLITSMSPNPVLSNASLALSAAKAGVVSFKVYDMSGKMVKQWHSYIEEGNNHINIDLNHLPSGIYHLLASTIETKTVFRFVKQ